MKNILIISGHPNLQHSLANAEILVEVEKSLPKAESRNPQTGRAVSEPSVWYCRRTTCAAESRCDCAAIPVFMVFGAGFDEVVD